MFFVVDNKTILITNSGRCLVHVAFTFTFMHLADALIQSDLQCIQVIHLYCQYVWSLGIEPTTFVLLTAMLYHFFSFLKKNWIHVLIEFPFSAHNTCKDRVCIEHLLRTALKRLLMWAAHVKCLQHFKCIRLHLQYLRFNNQAKPFHIFRHC